MRRIHTKLFFFLACWDCISQHNQVVNPKSEQLSIKSEHIKLIKETTRVMCPIMLAQKKRRGQRSWFIKCCLTCWSKQRNLTKLDPTNWGASVKRLTVQCVFLGRSPKTEETQTGEKTVVRTQLLVWFLLGHFSDLCISSSEKTLTGCWLELIWPEFFPDREEKC